MAFQIFTDSSSDLPNELREKYHIEFFRMGLLLNTEEKYADISWHDYSPEQLYEWIINPKINIKTSLITMAEFVDKVEPFLKKGIDILYIACTLALSGSLQNFFLAMEELKEKYPERKIIGVNSCRAAMTLGMICIDAAKEQMAGKSIEEVAQFVEDNKEYYHQVGSVETLSYLKAAGRISGAAAFFGNMIGLKPIVMFDIHGHNLAFKKVNGSKKALLECFEYVKENMVEGVTDVVYVGQAIAYEKQAYLKKRIEEELHIPVVETWIGPIIGISCGPGMYGIYFKGKEVTADSTKK